MSLADAQWARIEPLLPDRTLQRGGRWRDHRQVVDAIAFKYRTGTPWMDPPEHFGSWKGVHNRLRKWAPDNTWEKVFTALLAQADAEGEPDWGVAVDSTVVRAHQYAAGARHEGPAAGEPEHRALGRSRGGLWIRRGVAGTPPGWARGPVASHPPGKQEAGGSEFLHAEVGEELPDRRVDRVEHQAADGTGHQHAVGIAQRPDEFGVVLDL
ncbi:hypothetical protein CK485_17340 [Streptomyces sp. ICBB 8177]|nr:hypothetical protein CK485_17340 [Streptomyces sp. ICBB 8177]